jgi:hypothetical protein
MGKGLTGQQITGLVLAALAVVGVVLLATLADGAYVTELLFFLAGLIVPSPLSGGGGGGRRPRPPAVATGLLVVLAAMLLTGCGGSAIRYHAEGAAIATVAIEGAQGVYLRTLDDRMGACADEACVRAARADLRSWETGLDAADTATRSWRDAVEVALVAEESQALLDALMVAALRVLARWADVRTIAAPYGIDLPALALPAGLGGGAR